MADRDPLAWLDSMGAWGIVKLDTTGSTRLLIGLRRARDSWRNKALLKLTCDVCEHRHSARRSRRWEAAARRWWDEVQECRARWDEKTEAAIRLVRENDDIRTRLAEAEARAESAEALCRGASDNVCADWQDTWHAYCEKWGRNYP